MIYIQASHHYVWLSHVFIDDHSELFEWNDLTWPPDAFPLCYEKISYECQWMQIVKKYFHNNDSYITLVQYDEI